MKPWMVFGMMVLTIWLEPIVLPFMRGSAFNVWFWSALWLGTTVPLAIMLWAVERGPAF